MGHASENMILKVNSVNRIVRERTGLRERTQRSQEPAKFSTSSAEGTVHTGQTPSFIQDKLFVLQSTHLFTPFGFWLPMDRNDSPGCSGLSDTGCGFLFLERRTINIIKENKLQKQERIVLLLPPIVHQDPCCQRTHPPSTFSAKRFHDKIILNIIYLFDLYTAFLPEYSFLTPQYSN